MQNVPKLHHYLTRAYLHGFAGPKGEIVLRRRGAAPVQANVATVGAERHLYSVELPDGTRDPSAEVTLSHFDSAGARGLKGLRASTIPRSGTEERRALSVFLGLQVCRTPEFETQLLFPRNVVDYCGTEEPALDQVRRYLAEVHLQFEPEEPEVIAARDFVMAPRAMHGGLPSKKDVIEAMFNLALNELGPKLEAMTWSIEVCRKPRFATCDRLPAIWNRPSELDAIRGVGLLDAAELWLPLDVSHLLVLRRGGAERVEEVEPKRARFVNAHLAHHCFQATYHHPELKVRPDDFVMAKHRPATRFWTGPGYAQRSDGTRELIGELLHLWTPIRDDVQRRR
jgi:hypothetical protein